METIGFKSEFKQKENALETIDLYVPLAYRMGLYEIKKRLEDLSFKVLNPLEYNDVQRKITDYKNVNNDILKDLTVKIDDILRNNGINGKVTLRVKEVYSTYKKLLNLNKRQRQYNSQDANTVPIDSIHDLFAIKIITDDYLDCL